MKIEITWDSSTDAVFKIDGRRMKVRMWPTGGKKPKIDGLEDGVIPNTIGGLIAYSLYDKIDALMQAESVAYEEIGRDPSKEFTWEELPQDVADRITDMDNVL